MEFFESLVNQLMTASGGNQFLTGGVAVYLMGIATYLMRSVPMAILRFLDRRFIARMQAFAASRCANRSLPIHPTANPIGAVIAKCGPGLTVFRPILTSPETNALALSYR